jgi:hypothetical protein
LHFPSFSHFPISIYFHIFQEMENNALNLLVKAFGRISLFPNPKREKEMSRIPLKSLIFHFPVFLPLKGEYTHREYKFRWDISPPPFRGHQITNFFPFEISR